ncbi:hypothetical protein SAMN04487847_0118 [Microbacterium sp. cf332]|nr:hypothetical protein SAMN04487847_0118 [Microbacterium sp. cf332]
MWSEAQADPGVCPGGGRPAQPAPQLPDGFPGGRGLCAVCSGFVNVDGGVLDRHDAFRGTDDPGEAEGRARWFNTVGWN